VQSTRLSKVGLEKSKIEKVKNLCPSREDRDLVIKKLV